MSDATWRYRSASAESGPVTAEGLCGMFASGELPLTTEVWCAAVRRWVVAQTIPGFRGAAALAPKPAPAMFSGAPPVASESAAPVAGFSAPVGVLGDDGGDVEPPAGAEDSGGGFFRGAAKFARITPAAVIVVSALCRAGAASSGSADYHMDPKIALVCTLLIVAAFVAGLVALCGVRAYGRRGILAPAVWGLFLSGIMIVGGVAAAGFTRTANAQVAREGVASLTEFPGWFGIARLPGGGVGVGSYDAESPLARHITADLGKRYTVLCIAVDNSRGGDSIRVEPSDVRVETRDGIVKAVDLDRALQSPVEDTLSLRRRFGGAHRVKAGGIAEMICLMPAELDMHAATRAYLTVNGLQVTVAGRYMSARERRGFYEAGARAVERERTAAAN